MREGSERRKVWENVRTAAASREVRFNELRYGFENAICAYNERLRRGEAEGTFSRELMHSVQNAGKTFVRTCVRESVCERNLLHRCN